MPPGGTLAPNQRRPDEFGCKLSDIVQKVVRDPGLFCPDESELRGSMLHLDCTDSWFANELAFLRSRLRRRRFRHVAPPELCSKQAIAGVAKMEGHQFASVRMDAATNTAMLPLTWRLIHS